MKALVVKPISVFFLACQYRPFSFLFVALTRFYSDHCFTRACIIFEQEIVVLQMTTENRFSRDQVNELPPAPKIQYHYRARATTRTRLLRVQNLFFWLHQKTWSNYLVKYIKTLDASMLNRITKQYCTILVFGFIVKPSKCHRKLYNSTKFKTGCLQLIKVCRFVKCLKEILDKSIFITLILMVVLR